MNLDEPTKRIVLKEIVSGTCRLHRSKYEGGEVLAPATPDDLSADECEYEVSICAQDVTGALDILLTITDENNKQVTSRIVPKPEKAHTAHRTARCTYGWMLGRLVYLTKNRAETISNTYDFYQAKRNEQLKLQFSAKAAKRKAEESHKEMLGLHEELRSLRNRQCEVLVAGGDDTELATQIDATVTKLNKILEVYNKAALPNLREEDDSDE